MCVFIKIFYTWGDAICGEKVSSFRSNLPWFVWLYFAGEGLGHNAEEKWENGCLCLLSHLWGRCSVFTIKCSVHGGLCCTARQVEKTLSQSSCADDFFVNGCRMCQLLFLRL